jgi:hypothetical protein
MEPNMKKLFAIAFLMLLGSTNVEAAFINGSFETGTFAGWTTLGGTGVGFEPITTGTASPTNGSFMAGLVTGTTTQADVESFFGMTAGDLDVQLARDAFGGAGITQSITLQKGDVVSFDWNFLNGEGPSAIFRDTAFVVISSSATVLGDTLTPLSPDFFSTGFSKFSFQAPVEGTYNIGVGVVNVGDNTFTSGLYVDNFNVSTPLPPTAFAMIAGVAGIAGIRRRRS